MQNLAKGFSSQARLELGFLNALRLVYLTPSMGKDAGTAGLLEVPALKVVYRHTPDAVVACLVPYYYK